MGDIIVRWHNILHKQVIEKINKIGNEEEGEERKGKKGRER